MAGSIDYSKLVCVGSKKGWYNPNFFTGKGVGLKYDLGYVGQQLEEKDGKTSLRVLHVDTPPSFGASTSPCTLNKTLNQIHQGDVMTVPSSCLKIGEDCLERTTAVKDVIEKGWVSVPSLSFPPPASPY